MAQISIVGQLWGHLHNAMLIQVLTTLGQIVYPSILPNSNFDLMWNCNEGTGTTVVDDSGSGRLGTFYLNAQNDGSHYGMTSYPTWVTGVNKTNAVAFATLHGCIYGTNPIAGGGGGGGANTYNAATFTFIFKNTIGNSLVRTLSLDTNGSSSDPNATGGSRNQHAIYLDTSDYLCCNFSDDNGNLTINKSTSPLSIVTNGTYAISVCVNFQLYNGGNPATPTLEAVMNQTTIAMTKAANFSTSAGRGLSTSTALVTGQWVSNGSINTANFNRPLGELQNYGIKVASRTIAAMKSIHATMGF